MSSIFKTVETLQRKSLNHLEEKIVRNIHNRVKSGTNSNESENTGFSVVLENTYSVKNRI